MLGPDLGLATLALRGGGGGPLLLLDFAGGRYQRSGETAATFAELNGTSFSRDGAGLAVRIDGSLAAFAASAARITDRGLLLEPEGRNKVTIFNANPTSLSGVTKSGDANATLTLVNDMDALAAAGLSDVCTSGRAFKLDNSAGATEANVIVTGAATTVQHAYSAWARGSGAVRFWTNATPNSLGSQTLSGHYSRISDSLTGLATGSGLRLSITPGGVLHFILPQLEEGAVATSPIVTTGAAATRGADVALVTVPGSASAYAATYDGGLIATGAVTPGAGFDLVAGRPWLNGTLERLVMT
jgi:hypothetical protein